MTQNTLTIQINKSVHELFAFCITPPNSSRWIPGIVAEETNEWPVRVGTVFRLQSEKADWTDVVVTAMKNNQLVEFSKDGYHCRYTFRAISDHTAELKYHEWVDGGDLKPFSQETLEQLKFVVETSNF